MYLLLVFFESIKKMPVKRAMIVFLGIIITHIAYGIGFLKGVFTNKYKLKNINQLKNIKEQK